MVASQTAINKLSAFGTARSTIQGAPLTDIEAQQTQAFFRACNFLALGMIYLQDNPLLREPLRPEHIKNRLLGHWGASPALSFVYTHLNRVIKRDDLDMIFMAGPGHGAPGVLAPVYVEGSGSTSLNYWNGAGPFEDVASPSRRWHSRARCACHSQKR